MPSPAEALPGRADQMPLENRHHVLGTALRPPFPKARHSRSLGWVAFGESHDPTRGMRQGNDVGTQYRSGIYCYVPEQRALAESSRRVYGAALSASGLAPITTEILEAADFYYAEDYHPQYLSKNPNGYCGLGGTGVSCAI